MAPCERCGKAALESGRHPKWLTNRQRVEKYVLQTAFHVTKSLSKGNPEAIMCLKCLHELINKALVDLRGNMFE
jgi:hypothetical protein